MFKPSWRRFKCAYWAWRLQQTTFKSFTLTVTEIAVEYSAARSCRQVYLWLCTRWWMTSEADVVQNYRSVSAGWLGGPSALTGAMHLEGSAPEHKVTAGPLRTISRSSNPCRNSNHPPPLLSSNALASLFAAFLKLNFNFSICSLFDLFFVMFHVPCHLFSCFFSFLFFYFVSV